ncbi:MAG: serine protein kinase RIO [Euryarchaeota archaeon]|nr:serine protein kinase RIO [Euryarchaeota archaeon]|tara:strand:- start:906 stop:1790 length:885 start_codon:yes stop_codon:yes gene_type:complete
MPLEEDWDLPDPDEIMRSESKHEWISEPRYKKMFDDIEDALQGVMGRGKFEWVDRRVFDQVFDRSTLLALHKLMQQENIETIDYPIARGKEAHVFRASSQKGPLAVKIFHTTNAVFKGLAKYIDGDPRFSGLSRRHRELVNIWVRKEFRNLKRMRKSGLRVPEPMFNLKNVLVMEFIGDEDSPSPRLKDIDVENPLSVFEDLLEIAAVIWQTCDLVHADLSEYNILWYDEYPWVIDAGQAVTTRHPNAKEFLVRDVTRLTDWINRKGYEIQVADSLVRVLDGPVPNLSENSSGD